MAEGSAMLKPPPQMHLTAVIEQYISHLDRCVQTKNLNLVELLHSRLIKTGLALYTLFANRLVDAYSKCSAAVAFSRAAFDETPTKNHHSWNTMLSATCRAGDLTAARELFDQMPDPNPVSYNTMISSLTHHGHHREALIFFRRMWRNDHAMDRFAFVGAVSACAALARLPSLRLIHGSAVSTGLEINLIMSNVLIDAYGKCADIDAARLVFDRTATRDVVTWTSMVGALGFAGRLQDARLMFHQMPARNAVSWTALISSHEQNGEEATALDLFKQMMEEGISPTAFTLVSILSSCASLGLLARGKQAHGFIIRRTFDCGYSSLFICNALIDMYSKCGHMDLASGLFDRMTGRDIVSWNSMITAFAQNGQGPRAIALFENMTEGRFVPTDITFLALLSACSHGGLVSEGRGFLDSMKDYGLAPKPEHYAAFIDALGRSCRLKEAIELIESLPSTSAGTWGALLGACRMHGDLRLAKRAAESLFVLDPENGARYVTLSNIYSASGRWDDSRRVRVLMKEKGLKKEPGVSWIEVRNVKHDFVSEDKSHCQTGEIYRMLATLVDQIIELGAD